MEGGIATRIRGGENWDVLMQDSIGLISLSLIGVARSHCSLSTVIKSARATQTLHFRTFHFHTYPYLPLSLRTRFPLKHLFTSQDPESSLHHPSILHRFNNIILRNLRLVQPQPAPRFQVRASMLEHLLHTAVLVLHVKIAHPLVLKDRLSGRIRGVGFLPRVKDAPGAEHGDRLDVGEELEWGEQVAFWFVLDLGVEGGGDPRYDTWVGRDSGVGARELDRDVEGLAALLCWQ